MLLSILFQTLPWDTIDSSNKKVDRSNRANRSKYSAVSVYLITINLVPFETNETIKKLKILHNEDKQISIITRLAVQTE